jgi:hypothetical protein
MIPFKDFFLKPKTTWVAFISTIILSISFITVMSYWSFEVIDEIYDVEALKLHLAAMTDTQKLVHIWATATLDVLYPFAYGTLFISLALRFMGKWGPLLAVPSFAVIPVDLSEGLVQILLLTETANFYDLKVALTISKLGLFLIGLCVAIIAVMIVGYRYFNRRSAEAP